MNKVFSQFIYQVNAANIRRTIEHGEEFIYIGSATLPDDIIMHNGLYPKSEIERTYRTLEGTHAPIEHPRDKDGRLILATSPDAMVNGYLIGAKNVNVRRENGRVLLDKRIPVRLAQESEKGRRLLERISQLEKGTGEPIHTSTGLTLKRVPAANSNAGYDWVAEIDEFDHDAILLDTIGAAQPHQGVGIAVNHNGDEFEVLTYVANEEQPLIGNDHTEETTEKVNKTTFIEEIKQVIKDFFASSGQTNYNTSGQITANQEVDMNLEELQAQVAALSSALEANQQQTTELKAQLSVSQQVIGDLQGKIEANDNSKREALATAVAAKLRIEANDLTGLGLAALEKLHAEHCGVVAGINANSHAPKAGELEVYEAPKG